MSSPPSASPTPSNGFDNAEKHRMPSFAQVVKRKSLGAVLQFARKKEEEQIEWLDDAEKKRLMVATDGTRLTTIESICESTQLSKKEVQKMYRSFKETFPDGVVRQEEFRNVIASLFPHGDARPYADVLFNAINDDKDEIITFRELASAIAILNKGTTREKLEWSFQIYDQDKDRYISRKELAHVLQAVYGLVGVNAFPVVTGQTIKDTVIQKLDTNRDGIIDVNEFIQNCEKDPIMKGNLLILTGTIAQSPELSPQISQEDIAHISKRSIGSRQKRGNRPSTPSKLRLRDSFGTPTPSPPLSHPELSLVPPPPDHFEGLPPSSDIDGPFPPPPHSPKLPEATVTSPLLQQPLARPQVQPITVQPRSQQPINVQTQGPQVQPARSPHPQLARQKPLDVATAMQPQQPVTQPATLKPQVQPATTQPHVPPHPIQAPASKAPPQLRPQMESLIPRPQPQVNQPNQAQPQVHPSPVRSQNPPPYAYGFTRPQIPAKPRFPATPHGTFAPLPGFGDDKPASRFGSQERQPPTFSVPGPVMAGLLAPLDATSLEKDPEKELII